MGKMDEEFQCGYIFKSAEVSVQDVTESDLKKINQYTLEPVTADAVFVFKTVVGDNELDDRNYEPFNLAALKDLKRLYSGKTVLKDHRRSADSQVARIYDAELETEAKTTGAGEPFTKLITKSYMIKTGSNADLIAEIKGGIKKEVSTGSRAKRAICSICGTDNTKTYCPHYPGREYDKEDGKHTCYFTLDGVKEAYELSFVAVPAQPRAGTCKNYGETPFSQEENPNKGADDHQKSVLDLKIKNVSNFLFTNKINMEDSNGQKNA